MTRLAVSWRPIEPPRAPVAVLAEGVVANGLAESAARRLATGLDLRVAVGSGALLVLADPEALPWAAGVTYLGREQGLLLPTTLAPTVPVDLLDAAVRQLLARDGRPSRHVAVLPGRLIAFELSDTRADAAALRRHAVEAFA